MKQPTKLIKMKKPTDMEVRVLNFFDVADYISEQENYHRTWTNDLLYELEANNDSAFYVQVDTDPDINSDIVHKFYCGLVKHFDVKDQDGIMLWFSW
jgi:hypothetical protein